MGSISIDPSELADAGSALASIAGVFEGGGGRLSLGPVAGPSAVASALPDLSARWARWIVELEEVIADLGGGLSAAAHYYEQRERDIAAWVQP